MDVLKIRVQIAGRSIRMANEQILLIDDDNMILKAVQTALQREFIQVHTATTGKKAIELLKAERYEVIIVDLLMPDMDGFELIRQIREQQIFTPIIIISGKEEEHNKILGLGLGADDYLTKPFSIHLLLSKVKAFIRRNNVYQNQEKKDVVVGPFRMQMDTFRIYKGTELLDLTSKETLLLKYFLENPNRVFTKEQLYRQIWNDVAIDDNTIMVYIRRIRAKIEEEPKNPQYLKTVWGIGYEFAGKN